MGSPGADAFSLGALLRAAAAERFPPVDGGWHRIAPWRAGVEAVVGFTRHSVLAVADDVPDSALDRLGLDGYGGAHQPWVVQALAGEHGWIDSLDVLLVASGAGGPPALVTRVDSVHHPRAVLARLLRDDVRVLGRAHEPSGGLVTIAAGIGGLTEMSVEIPEPARGAGVGRALITDALSCVPAGEPVLAAVAPGNSASLRAFLGAGFAPVASVQLYRPGPRRLTA